MVKTVLTAAVTYLATGLDEIPVLFILYNRSSNKGKEKTITAAYFAGTFLLLAFSFLGAFGIILFPVKWAAGLIGLVPIVMGIKLLIKGDGDDEEEAMAASGGNKILPVQIFLITLSLGTDDLGVYVPLFATLTASETVVFLLVFTLGTALLCFVSYRLTEIKRLSRFLERRERYITAIIFILIGIGVLMEYRTLNGIVSFFFRQK